MSRRRASSVTRPSAYGAGLVDEHGVEVAETTVRDHVRKRRRELGHGPREVFVPQIHAPGRTAEVDWGEADVDLTGARTRVHLFFMRSCFSGAAFSMASPVETQQAFLEGHARAFEWFGGVFCEVRYDNLGSAVKAVLKGRRRVESDRFVALGSHYLYDSLFATPGIQGAHEKGGVEGEVGRLRRNHLVPVPAVESIAQLNALLVAACERDLGRQIAGRPGTVCEQHALERPVMRALPDERFDATEVAAVRVDAKALVTVRQNRYSVPVCLAGLRVGARVGANEMDPDGACDVPPVPATVPDPLPVLPAIARLTFDSGSGLPEAFDPATVLELDGVEYEPRLDSSSADEFVARGVFGGARVDRDATDGVTLTVEGEDGIACLTPTEVGSGASEPTDPNAAPIDPEPTTLAANTLPGTDTAVRPSATGLDAILQLRSALAPQRFSWHVDAAYDLILAAASSWCARPSPAPTPTGCSTGCDPGPLRRR